MDSVCQTTYMITLLVALFVLGILIASLMLALNKFAGSSRMPLALLGIVLAVHLSMALFIFYADFYDPLGGSDGDQSRYHAAAVDLAQSFRHGAFSPATISHTIAQSQIDNWYPVALGILYAVSMPDLLVGMMLSVWLAVVGVLLVYFISRELGISARGAFAAGLVASFYPTYVYLGSFLVKDTLVVPLVLLAVLLTIKIIKQFSWRYFFIFYLILAALIHLRFYIGIVVLYMFLFSWPFLLGFHWKRKIGYGLIVFSLLGFLPQVFGYGYYGVSIINKYTQPEKIVAYREVAYAPKEPAVVQQPPADAGSEMPVGEPSAPVDSTPPVAAEENQEPRGPGATIIVEAGIDNPLSFIRNYFISFSYVLLGPFPWHLKYSRHFISLLESIPWAILFFFTMRGVIRNRERWRLMLPILLLGFGTILVLSLLIDNFGVYMRLRMPAFLAFMSLLPFSFQGKKHKS